MTSNGKEKKRPAVSMGWVRGMGQEFKDRELRSCTEEANEVGFEFMTHYIGGEARAQWDPVGNPLLRVEDLPKISTVDLQMTSNDWARWVVGRFSPWIDLDSEDSRLRELSTTAFSQEIEYMRYLGLSAILIELKRSDNPNLARELGSRLWTKLGFVSQCWVVVPVCPFEEGNGDCDKDSDTWEWWYKFKTQMGGHRRLNLSLRLTPDLPGTQESRNEIVKRWMGEPIASVFLDTSLFTSNKFGAPLLPKSHKTFLLNFFRLQCQVILEGSRTQICKQLKPFITHVNQVWEERLPMDSISEWSRGYEDHLQVPLQPLSDNLESSTYEVFERDPVKYKRYQEAIVAALSDLEAKQTDKSDLVLMVLGAGRGPIVTAALKAIEEVDPRNHVQVFAIEKNPNSVVTLKYLRDTLWNNKVEVVETDMRHFEPTQKADIIVSELLGSFGDNELSPECLDGALHVMKPTCISIPSKYTSFLAPVHSPRLFTSIRDEFSSNSVVVTGNGLCNGSRPSITVTENLTADGVSDVLDLPYVVRLQNHYLIAEPQEVFVFNHPNWKKESNERHATLTFKTSLACELMGFAGYFDTVLYGDIKLSIVPRDHTEGMFSWFPALFPVSRPVYVEANQEIIVDIWRIIGGEKAWYEWLLRSPQQLRVQNTGGMGHSMALF